MCVCVLIIGVQVGYYGEKRVGVYLLAAAAAMAYSGGKIFGKG